MIFSELTPRPSSKVQFKAGFFKSVPKEAGCYILTTFDGVILYIGLSDNLFDRFQQHLSNPEKTNPTSNGKAVWFYYSLYDIRNLPKLERSWINQYTTKHSVLPILNRINSPIS